ncbi:MAG: MFS transporter [Blastocatellia bacterium]|nr:MFS transporter [Blastocatellia bacterium]
MTTVVVVKKNGHACIAADTLTSWGSTRQTSSYLAGNSKIVKVSDSYLGISGSATHKFAIESYFADCDRYSFKSKQDIFETWREFHKSLKENYHLKPGDDKEDPYETTHMHVLIANPHGIFGIYALRSVNEYKKFWAFGSGTDYALGALHCSYDRYDKPEDIARIAIEAAAEFDSGTALPVTIHSVELLGD